MLDMQSHWVKCVIIKDVDSALKRPSAAEQDRPCFETLMAQFTQACTTPLPKSLSSLSKRYKHHDPRVAAVRADMIPNFADMCRRAGRMVLVCDAA